MSISSPLVALCVLSKFKACTVEQQHHIPRKAGASRALTGTCRALSADAPVHAHAQVLEIWKILLDPDTMEGAVEKNRFLDLFYEGCIGTLTETLAESALPKVRGLIGSKIFRPKLHRKPASCAAPDAHQWDLQQSDDLGGINIEIPCSDSDFI